MTHAVGVAWAVGVARVGRGLEVTWQLWANQKINQINPEPPNLTTLGISAIRASFAQLS